MNIHKSIKYINANGNPCEKARLSAILKNQKPSLEVVEGLRKFQNPNGGFSYWIKDMSTITDTCYILEWFDDLKIHKGDIVDRACNYLLKRQKNDGGWDEEKDVIRYNPPKWMIPNQIKTRTWLTAYCAHVLIRFGYAEAEGTICPTNFLLANCDSSGRVKGYLRATWLALPMLNFYPGPNPELFIRMVKVIMDNFSIEWRGSYIAWLLQCLKDGDLSSNHNLVQRSLYELKRKQRNDGSWDPEEGEGEKHRINSTLRAIRALKEYKII